MSFVELLEQRIAKLNAAEFKELSKWFDRRDAEVDAEVWDRQIEKDSQNGKLRQLIDRALSDDRSGPSTEL
jgi:predicted AAA+ superfamily ATPase